MALTRAHHGSSEPDSSVETTDDDLGGGLTVISDSVVAKVAGVAARGVTGVHSLGSAPVRAFGAIREALTGMDLSQGVNVTVTDADVVVDIVIVAEFPFPAQETATEVRASITQAIGDFVGLRVTAVNVTINDVHHPAEDEHGSSEHNETSRATASGKPRDTPRESDNTMSASDKIKNTAEDLKGKTNEAVGKATNDDSKVAEGRAEQTSASAKKAGENIKDVFKD